MYVVVPRIPACLQVHYHVLRSWGRFAIVDHFCLTQQILLKAFPLSEFIKLQPWQPPNTQNTLQKGKYLRRKSQHIRYVVLEWHVTGTEEFDSKNTCLPLHSCWKTARWQLLLNCSDFLKLLIISSLVVIHVYMCLQGVSKGTGNAALPFKALIFPGRSWNFAYLSMLKHLPKASAFHL